MRLVSSPRGSDRVPYPLIFGAVTLLCAGAAWLRISLTTGWIPPLCVFRGMTGIPCPTCHTTRALAALLTGRIGAALLLNPLITLLALGSVLAAAGSAALRIAGRGALSLEVGPREKVALRSAAAVLLAANWIYLVATR